MINPVVYQCAKSSMMEGENKCNIDTSDRHGKSSK